MGLGSENIFLIADDFSVSVTFTCKFKSEVTASSDEIKIEDINVIDGNLEQEGNWQDSSKIANSEDTEFILGSTLNIKAAWSSSNLPIAQKINWYIKTCRVYDAKRNPEVT